MTQRKVYLSALAAKKLSVVFLYLEEEWSEKAKTGVPRKTEKETGADWQKPNGLSISRRFKGRPQMSSHQTPSFIDLQIPS